MVLFLWKIVLIFSRFNKIIKPEPFSLRHLLNQTRLPLSWRPNLALLKLLVSFFNFTSPRLQLGGNAERFGSGDLQLASRRSRVSLHLFSFKSFLGKGFLPSQPAGGEGAGATHGHGGRLSRVSAAPGTPGASPLSSHHLPRAGLRIRPQTLGHLLISARRAAAQGVL